MRTSVTERTSFDASLWSDFCSKKPLCGFTVQKSTWLLRGDHSILRKYRFELYCEVSDSRLYGRCVWTVILVVYIYSWEQTSPMSDCRECDPAYPSSRPSIDHFVKLAAYCVQSSLLSSWAMGLFWVEAAVVQGFRVPNASWNRLTRTRPKLTQTKANERLWTLMTGQEEAKTKHCILRNGSGHRYMFLSWFGNMVLTECCKSRHIGDVVVLSKRYLDWC